MEKKEKYEQMYEMLVTYERKIHEKNQKRISIGLKCIIIIPLIFLFQARIRSLSPLSS